MRTLYKGQTSSHDIVIGIVAPMGAGKEIVQQTLGVALKRHGYKGRKVALTDWLDCQLPADKKLSSQKARTHEWYKQAQKMGNWYCTKHETQDAMARLAVYAIAALRERSGRLRPSERMPNAFVVSSLKRPAEVDLLRAIYGKSFVLLGVHDTQDALVEQLAERLAANDHRKRTDQDILDATELLVTDAAEPNDTFGQNVGKAYPLADAFVDASRPACAVAETERLVSLMFKPSFHSPSRDECAMAHAHAAGLRSVDLGRQVGAVLVSPEGDIIATGTNDVPRAGGGIAWEGDADDARDFRLRRNVSKERRVRTAFELLSLLKEAVEAKKEVAGSQLEQLLEGSQLFALGEFGRAVHAEMDAILSAARLGVPVRGASAYTTTFPCHNCVRHMIGAGIARVVYMVPYEKSLAFELHDDAIAKEGRDPRPNKVVFERFVGIAPCRYADFFAAGKNERKDDRDEPAFEKERELKDHFRVDRKQYEALEAEVTKQIPRLKLQSAAASMRRATCRTDWSGIAAQARRNSDLRKVCFSKVRIRGGKGPNFGNRASIHITAGPTTPTSPTWTYLDIGPVIAYKQRTSKSNRVDLRSHNDYTERSTRRLPWTSHSRPCCNASWPAERTSPVALRPRRKNDSQHRSD